MNIEPPFHDTSVSVEQEQEQYESHRSLIDPVMKQRLSELVETAKKYRTKACGMQKMIGLVSPQSYDIEMQRLQRRSRVRKPPIPQSSRSNSQNRNYLAKNNIRQSSAHNNNARQQQDENRKPKTNQSYTSPPPQQQHYLSTTTERVITRPYSISTFTKDEDFIEFLKKIELFVTDEESPRKGDYVQPTNHLLYQNLKYIREKFKEYRQFSQPHSFRVQEPIQMQQYRDEPVANNQYQYREEPQIDEYRAEPVVKRQPLVETRPIRDENQNDPLAYIDNLYNKFFNDNSKQQNDNMPMSLPQSARRSRVQVKSQTKPKQINFYGSPISLQNGSHISQAEFFRSYEQQEMFKHSNENFVQPPLSQTNSSDSFEGEQSQNLKQMPSNLRVRDSSIQQYLFNIQRNASGASINAPESFTFRKTNKFH